MIISHAAAAAAFALLLVCAAAPPAAAGHARHLRDAPADGTGRETALLGESATFRCAVQGPDGDAAEVDIWWQFEGKNVTLSDRVQVRLTELLIGDWTSLHFSQSFPDERVSDPRRSRGLRTVPVVRAVGG